MDSPVREMKHGDLIKFISEVKIYNELESQKILILDFRTKEQFQEACLNDFSINLPCNEITEELCENPRLIDDHLLEKYAHSDFLRNCLKKFRRNFVAIIMANEKIRKEEIASYTNFLLDIRNLMNDDLEEKRYSDCLVKPLKLYKNLIRLKVRELGLYNKGFNLFKEKFPFLLHNNQITPSLFKGHNGFHGFPSIILNDRLYVGDQYHACSQDVVSHLKITHIVNATQHVENKFENIKYIRVNIDDTPSFKIAPYFKPVYEFIENAFSEDNDEGYESSNLKEIIIGQNSNGNYGSIILHSDDYNHFTPKKLPKKSRSDFSEDSVIPLLNPNVSLQEAFEREDCLFRKDNIFQKEFKKFVSQHKNNNRVLIHCSLGVSRSASLTIMYIMKKFSLSYENALNITQYHRDKSSPMSKFAYELEDFEKNGFNYQEE